jgi:tetratricopeptide (TPR) repeat protein
MRGALAVTVVALLAHGAAADGQSKADELFERAQQAKQAGHNAEACKLYEDALRANPNAVGTLLNVAKCSEDAGKVATAVKLYTQARDIAREHDLAEHRKAAEQRLALIGDRVPRLAIGFAERPDNMKLLIDDEVVPTDAESTNELRLDPGSRHIVVTAPGRLPYATDVVLVEGKQQAIAIPALARPAQPRTRKTAGIILAGSGIALAATGLVLGYRANATYDEQFENGNCHYDPAGGGKLCNATGFSETSEARQLATVGTVVGIAGVAALATGIVLWVTAPGERSHQVAVLPTVTEQSAAITAFGRF